MANSFANSPRQLQIAPRSRACCAVRRDIRADQEMREWDITLFRWQYASGTPHAWDLIPPRVPFRMTIEAVRKVSQVLATSEALWRTRKRGGIIRTRLGYLHAR
ncbi:MAG: hypothetical protein JO266_12870 [Acidobacteria bacterium]|nr:hypothetical protein [Acidobacteriota bacterium]